jgi:GT2 family glycosyltransferase/glycosyltransferase involved in cell wall biosynthesis
MRHVKYQLDLIKSSPFFDGEWYAEQHPDIAVLGLDPAEHYIRIGAGIHRDPSPRFNTKFYLQSNPDVVNAGMNPLVHFIEHGINEQRAAVPHMLVAAGLSVRIDVVVPVFNALADVQQCLKSLRSRRDGYNVRVIVVNDGSDQPTSQWLVEFCSANGDFELLEHATNQGYTKAVNTGLRHSTAPYVITLNSDTIVTRGWLKGLFACMCSASDIGIVGPLSNAASWQNVPDLRDSNGSFAINELPEAMTPDEMSAIVAMVSTRQYPRMPFINGFCFMIRRQVIDAIGYMDEENFPVGYGEENDFCIRAADAGFALAVADDAYVFHAKSKSFGHERRAELSRNGSEALKAKHTPAKFGHLVAKVKDTASLDEVRNRIKAALHQRSSACTPVDIMAMRLLLLLPVRGGGGGAHSVVQEVVAMRRLGVQANVAVKAEHLEGFRQQYRDIPEIDDVLVGFHEGRLSDMVDGYDVVVATIYSSMRLVMKVCEEHPHILPAYYVQDYEPLFFPEKSENWDIARDSYELVPGATLFAKTHWLINQVKQEHGVDMHKVEPSVDHSVYKPRVHSMDGLIHLAAMIRPQTPRRGAERTMRVLSRLSKTNPGKLAIHIFGCADAELGNLAHDFECRNHGILNRPEVAAVLAQADIFIDLSDYQAFGRTALEAMACGCTSVVPAHGGADEYAIDNVNALIVDSFDEEECFLRLNELTRSPPMLASLRQEALKTASRYSVHRAAVSELVLFGTQLAKHRMSHPRPPKSRLILIPSVRKDGSTPTGSAWVRCLLPYRSEGVRNFWTVIPGSRKSLPAPGTAEVALLQRDATGIAMADLDVWLQAWRGAGGRLIYEIDDDLLDGEGMRERGLAEDADALASSVRWMARNADLVTVSTQQLADKFRPFNSEIHVIPNRLDRGLWRLGNQGASDNVHMGTREGPVRIGYIGTPTHDADMALIADAMRRIERDYGERVKIEVIGGFEHCKPLFGTRVPLPRRNDYPSFVSWLFQRVNWEIALLPLVDDPFNASKSHLKFLEYGALGLGIVCSDVPSYRSVATHESNCLVVRNDSQAWYEAVARMIDDRELRARLASAASAMVSEQHTIDVATLQYVDAISAAHMALLPQIGKVA